ncbi:unnamed protein product [Meloidogyne enterolobii]|uniref:DUF7153 domain-containing protein n=2 Tax=Meloidogyne enterolobii TaxID=390850 RepID=A0A6V7XHH2_MELEN|nr:unnamed protein product [Meloidogyne enterolobii]
MPRQQPSSSSNYLILNLLSNKNNTFIFDSINCVFPNLQNCRSIELRRFKCCSFNENSENLNKYIDAIFVETNNSPIKKRENKEICIFEEIQSVEWKGVSNFLSEDDESEFGNKEGNYCSITKSFTGQSSIWGEYIIEEKYEEDKYEGEEEEEEEEQNYRGHLFFGYKCSKENIKLNSFVSDWYNWCAIRELCQLLPSKCLFRKVSFYKNIEENNFYFNYFLIIEVENVLLEINNVINCINNVQLLCYNKANIGLYEEIEFEIDLELLQELVLCAKAINCSNHRLAVNFNNVCSFRGDLKEEKFSTQPPFLLPNSSVCPSFSSISIYSENNLICNNFPKERFISNSTSIYSNSDYYFDAQMDEIEYTIIPENKIEETSFKNFNFEREEEEIKSERIGKTNFNYEEEEDLKETFEIKINKNERNISIMKGGNDDNILNIQSIKNYPFRIKNIFKKFFD